MNLLAAILFNGLFLFPSTSSLHESHTTGGEVIQVKEHTQLQSLLSMWQVLPCDNCNLTIKVNLKVNEMDEVQVVSVEGLGEAANQKLTEKLRTLTQGTDSCAVNVKQYSIYLKVSANEVKLS